MAGESKVAVGSAIAANSVVTVAKGATFFVTGSGAMLSEAIHSFADTFNQILLMVGIVRSSREADARFPFGYGPERYVWALMSAVGIFFLGCGVTVYHGVQSLLHPHELESLGWAIVVLIFAFVVEAIVLVVAIRQIKKAAKGRPFFRYVRQGADPSAVAVLLEDAAACLGVLIALAGIGLARATGSPVWDAVGSILIGLLLGAVAIWLIVRNRHLLVGPSIPPEARAEMRRILEQHPAVERLVLLRTRLIDTRTWRVSADVDFAGERLAESMENDLRAAWDRLDSWEEFRVWAGEYAEAVLDRMGSEVDALETKLRGAVPETLYVDLEGD